MNMTTEFPAKVRMVSPDRITIEPIDDAGEPMRLLPTGADIIVPSVTFSSLTGGPILRFQVCLVREDPDDWRGIPAADMTPDQYRAWMLAGRPPT